MVRTTFLLFVLAAGCLAQANRYNYDEAKVRPYAIPDPLALSDGQPVKDAATWNDKRRPELLALFEEHVYGKTPAGSTEARSTRPLIDMKALGGKAVRKQVTIFFTDRNDGPRMQLLVYLPPGAARVPVILGLNFNGNHTLHADTGIEMNDVWTADPIEPKKRLHLQADDRTRGSNAAAWQVEKILSHGYGLATIYYSDIEPDFPDGMRLGVRSLFPEPQNWSALGAWAWGLSRAVDYLRADARIDPGRIGVIGHSRLGKAALWAAAQDTRFSLVISNESGKGGASLLRRGFGETIDHLNSAFPHWFAPAYKQYTGHPERLPVDGNELLALVAPRPLYVASAAEDLGSDPKGEFLSTVNVGKVYALLGRKGVGVTQMPAVDQAVMRDVGYHVRSGRHDVTEFDWDQYLAFADMHWHGGVVAKPAPPTGK